MQLLLAFIYFILRLGVSGFQVLNLGFVALNLRAIGFYLFVLFVHVLLFRSQFGLQHFDVLLQTQVVRQQLLFLLISACQSLDYFLQLAYFLLIVFLPHFPCVLLLNVRFQIISIFLFQSGMLYDNALNLYLFQFAIFSGLSEKRNQFINLLFCQHGISFVLVACTLQFLV